MHAKWVLYGILVALVALGASRSAHAAPWWGVQAVDTMKYSRDMARQAAGDLSYDATIDAQMQNISKTGATHVAIATPYDEEFYPVLKRWVDSARRYNLNVWFRGNWSGWEGWFGYARISRTQHMQQTKDFLRKHASVFQDGDIFSACPECENGGPGDPRTTGDIAGYRSFIVSEYQLTKNAFRTMHKDVASNWQSMNADVARAVMDPVTTEKMDGLVVIDHYVKDPAHLARDVEDIAEQSGGMVALGEFGAPIPDIHGAMTEHQQAQWLDAAMKNLVGAKHLVGLSYWVNMGGSTKLWNDDGSARNAAATLTSYYSPKSAHGRLKGIFDSGISDATITSSEGRTVAVDHTGTFDIPYNQGAPVSFHISASPYAARDVSLEDIVSTPEGAIAMQVHGLITKIMLAIRYIIHLIV